MAQGFPIFVEYRMRLNIAKVNFALCSAFPVFVPSPVFKGKKDCVINSKNTNMKQLRLPFLENLDDLSLENVENILTQHGARDNISTLNWANEYSYCPRVDFYIAYSKTAVYLKFDVNEDAFRAVYTKDLSPVYQDSCVEFFCKQADQDYYMNFEFNCVGTCDASRRKGRDSDVRPYKPYELAKIERLSCIMRNINNGNGQFEWQLTVKIPFELMSLDYNNLPDKLQANFYKCGDETDKPHFVTWNPINTEKPDFHVPAFFGELLF